MLPLQAAWVVSLTTSQCSQRAGGQASAATHVLRWLGLKPSWFRLLLLGVQVSFEFASVLQELGFKCNSMGGETRLDIATYNFAGRRAQWTPGALAFCVQGWGVTEVAG
jgi:hypothetical protein